MFRWLFRTKSMYAAVQMESERSRLMREIRDFALTQAKAASTAGFEENVAPLLAVAIDAEMSRHK